MGREGEPRLRVIHGEAEPLEALSDMDLLAGIDRAAEDMYRAENRANNLIGEAVRRGLYPLEPAISPEDRA